MGAGRKHRRPGEPAPRHDFLTRRVLERQFPVRREARGPVVGPATGWQLPVACSGTRCKGERARRADPSTTATIRSSSGINRRTARSTDARTRPSLPRRTSTAAASSARTAKARPRMANTCLGRPGSMCRPPASRAGTSAAGSTSSPVPASERERCPDALPLQSRHCAAARSDEIEPPAGSGRVSPGRQTRWCNLTTIPRLGLDRTGRALVLF